MSCKMIAILLSLAALSFAQTSTHIPDSADQAQAARAQSLGGSPSPNSTSTCTYSFATPGGFTFLRSCVTVNGNVAGFQSPAGDEDIAIGLIGEGYGWCDTTSSPVAYYDWADYGDSGNWNAPVTLTSTATSVKIARTTSDGVWTITQTFVQNAANSNLKITVTLKNNTASLRFATFFRWVDVDANNGVLNNLDSSATGAFGWSSSAHGLVLENATQIGTIDGFANNTFTPPNVCSPSLGHTLLTKIDGSMGVYYLLAITPHAAKSVAMTYKAL